MPSSSLLETSSRTPLPPRPTSLPTPPSPKYTPTFIPDSLCRVTPSYPGSSSLSSLLNRPYTPVGMKVFSPLARPVRGCYHRVDSGWGGGCKEKKILRYVKGTYKELMGTTTVCCFLDSIRRTPGRRRLRCIAKSAPCTRSRDRRSSVTFGSKVVFMREDCTLLVRSKENRKGRERGQRVGRRQRHGPFFSSQTLQRRWRSSKAPRGPS